MCVGCGVAIGLLYTSTVFTIGVVIVVVVVSLLLLCAVWNQITAAAESPLQKYSGPGVEVSDDGPNP